jgi:hypothetical protein
VKTVFLKNVVEKWLAERERVEDCTCQDEDVFGGCWFHLPRETQIAERVDSFRKALAEAGDVL